MWGTLIFVIGIIYGWAMPGRENKARLLWNGLWLGLILGIVFAVLGVVVGASALSLGGDFVAIFLTVLILTLLFILGAWVGDLIEGGMRRYRTT
jgi:hypothetical protein